MQKRRKKKNPNTWSCCTGNGRFDLAVYVIEYSFEVKILLFTVALFADCSFLSAKGITAR